MGQRLLVDSNVVSLAEFRERRDPTPVGRATPRPFQGAPRPVSPRSIAHQARMLAHLERMANASQ